MDHVVAAGCNSAGVSAAIMIVIVTIVARLVLLDETITATRKLTQSRTLVVV